MHVDSKGLRVFPYTKEHYGEIAKFYTLNGWKEAPVEACLPDLGFIVRENGGPILAVGFLYETNSIMYVLEWTATNPEAPLKPRAKAFKLLIKTIMALVKRAKPNGQIVQFTPSEAIVRTYKRLGFTATERATLLHWS